MFAKRSLRCCYYVIIFVSLLCWSSSAIAITIDELADICEAMEKNIQDIHIEFEWDLDPPPDINEMPGKNFLMSKGPEKFTWATKRPFGQFSLSTQEATVVNQYGHSHKETIKQSYNGKIAKRLQKSSWQHRNDLLEGYVTRRDNLVLDMRQTPAGFSILHFSLRKAAGRKPLSEFLRDNKEVISLDDNIVKINGFNAIKVDILHKITKVLWGTVYFSVEHGYTPVRYEYWNGSRKRLITRYNITSFEKISDGLWFPKSGYIESPDDDRRTVFTASKIILNQGLSDEYFDFEFPPGTRVVDEISGTCYVFHPTEGKLNQKQINELYPCCATSKDKAGVAEQSEAVDTNSVEAILKQLKEKTTKLESYQAQLEYRFKQPLLESETLRKGILYYQKFDGKSRLRVNFQTLKQDDERQQKYIEHFIFDGVWLTHIDYQIRAVRRYQLAEPNKPVNAFDLAKRGLPIIGFTKIEDLKKQFEIKLVQQEKDKAEKFFHLHLKVKLDSIYRDWPVIDFWIDKKLYLPAKVVAVSTEEDIYEIKFLQPKVNKEIVKKVFEFEIPKGFTV
ncbi:MAG: hypothetical protein ACE5NG_19200, partial [bacterium]